MALACLLASRRTPLQAAWLLAQLRLQKHQQPLPRGKAPSLPGVGVFEAKAPHEWAWA